MPHWGPPAGFAGLDLRPLPLQEQRDGAPGLSVFWGDGDPGSDYESIGDGSWLDLKPDSRLRDMLPRPRGYSVQGDTLRAMLLDLLTDGADPEGLDGPKPLVPTVQRRLELHSGGEKHVEVFAWGDPRTAKIQALLKSDFARMFAAADAGLTHPDLPLKWLDDCCKKYGLNGAEDKQSEDWKQFVPASLVADVPGPEPRETTITDDFTRADGGTIGNLLTWAEVSGVWATISNKIRHSEDASYGYVRAESDLSSSDHYSQWAVTINNIADQFGPVCRFSSSELTCYLLLARAADILYRTYKNVAGSYTQLDPGNTLAVDSNIYKIQANGSTISVFRAGADQQDVTDTAITGNTRCGAMAFTTSTPLATDFDDFEAADLGGEEPDNGPITWRLGPAEDSSNYITWKLKP